MACWVAWVREWIVVRNRQQFDSNNWTRAVHDVTSPPTSCSATLAHCSTHQSINQTRPCLTLITDSAATQINTRHLYSNFDVSATATPICSQPILWDIFSCIFYELRMGATTAEKLRGTKVWAPTPGRKRPASGQRPGWVLSAGGGRPSRCECPGVSPPDNF